MAQWPISPVLVLVVPRCPLPAVGLWGCAGQVGGGDVSVMMRVVGKRTWKLFEDVISDISIMLYLLYSISIVKLKKIYTRKIFFNRIQFRPFLISLSHLR